MYKITMKEKLTNDIKLMGIQAPHITKNAKAGNFIVLINDEKGERIPLTIYDWDSEKGIVYTIFQEVGVSTIKLGQREPGESIYAAAGPMGKPFHIEKFGHTVIIGGGVGVPAIYPIARALTEAGNKVTSITGFRTKELIILEEEMKRVSENVLVATNDGSYGVKGFVTDVLRDMIDKGGKIDAVAAVGPAVMMKAVSDLTAKYNIHTIVSLNAVMVDGTGMCGGCRVTVGGEVKYSCVDGPDFNAHEVDFNELLSRQSAYKDEEKESLHSCRLDGRIKEAPKND
ncbi:MAG: sulfide/dihydroorotate dehydrogenase-like FAD/NAD-binding protein [Candidatus Goldiibacteriota bacterium]